MTHLTEDSAVRRDDAFDSVHGAVRVERNVHSGVAAEVNVLSSHLTVRDKLLYYALRSYEAALAMGYRNIVDIADVAAAEPRGLVGADTSQGKLRLMAADGVVGQRGAFSGQRNYLSERNKAKLD